MLPQPTALVDKRVCLAFSWLPFAIEQRTLARRAPVCQRSCTSASTDALERRARSTASRKSRHCMIHGKPTYMRTCGPPRARQCRSMCRIQRDRFMRTGIGSYYSFKTVKAAREMTVQCSRSKMGTYRRSRVSTTMDTKLLLRTEEANRFTGGPPRFPHDRWLSVTIN